MTSILLPFVLLAMDSLAPSRDHTALGSAIASVVESEAPLFADDEDRRRTTSLVVAVAFRESSLRNDAVGDHGHSVCAMQIYDGPKALLTDPEACIRRGLAMLRTSMRVCAASPLAWYAAGGSNACTNDRAARISRDRVALAKRVHAAATAALAKASSS